MNSFIKGTAAAAVVFAGNATAGEILVTTDIATSTTWTTGNTYNLQDQIYVLPGATLTIEPGVIVASTTGIGGSLAVSRGAQIFVNGTQSNPVIMTSTADVATWTGGDPKTGVWREGANEWGNLTIMGAAYVSENAVPGNVASPNAANEGLMEGLIESFPGDPKVRYGGGDDGDDVTGTVKYTLVREEGDALTIRGEYDFD